MELLVLIIILILILIFTAGEKQHRTPNIYVEPTQPTKKQKSQYTHDVLNHILLFGLPGIGKTTLCEIIAHKLSTKYGHKVSPFAIAISHLLCYDVARCKTPAHSSGDAHG